MKVNLNQPSDKNGKENKNKGFTVITVENFFDHVLCDLCNKDYTNDNTSGGIYFSAKAVCPDCAPRFEKVIKECNEEKYIEGRCPKNKSFANWVKKDLR